MKILVIDFYKLLNDVHTDSLHTKTFEIYYDISRMLDISVSREAAFKLYTKYMNNYGKLKDYLCILGPNSDKKRFDEEFMRRYSQLYFHTDLAHLEAVKDRLSHTLDQLSHLYFTALVGIGNKEFMRTTLKHLDLVKYFNTVKVGEYLLEYPEFIESIVSENTVEPNHLETVSISVLDEQDDIRSLITQTELYKSGNIEFSDFLTVANSR